MFPDQPRTPPNTGATSMKTAPEIQTTTWNPGQYEYCNHGKLKGICPTCDKYRKCPECGTRNCRLGCKHQIHRPCYLYKGKTKLPLNEEQTSRLGVRFQKRIPLTEEEKEKLKKGKLPDGRISEHRSERSNAPEPSSQDEPQENKEETPAPPEEPSNDNNNNIGEPGTGSGDNGNILPPNTGEGGDPDSDHSSDPNSSSDSSYKPDDPFHPDNPVQIRRQERRRMEVFISNLVRNL